MKGRVVLLKDSAADALWHGIRATKPGAGVEEVLIPGDTERRTRAERTRNGVPLPDDTWAAIVNIAREVGVSEVAIQRATS